MVGTLKEQVNNQLYFNHNYHCEKKTIKGVKSIIQPWLFNKNLTRDVKSKSQYQ